MFALRHIFFQLLIQQKRQKVPVPSPLWGATTENFPIGKGHQYLVLIGGSGKDELYGGNGNDTLDGNDRKAGMKQDGNADLLVGGRGADKFLVAYWQATPGSSQVKYEELAQDFDTAQGDANDAVRVAGPISPIA